MRCVEDSPTVTDIDGNVYHIVLIGTQIWMVENLKTTRYNDGSKILVVSDSATWTHLTIPGYCWYMNDPANKAIYGALYNGYTVNTGKLAPVGWHVPADTDWTTLTTYLGGDAVAGGKLKEVCTAHWFSPNTGADDRFGFTALPGGFRDYNGQFSNAGYNGFWWSSTDSAASSVWYYNLVNSHGGAIRGIDDKGNGFSVRCVLD